ncbi:MAG: CCA tRNA nucleotidyltransferase [Bacilli bacterium]|nr:CCA tRNA nucleotidyltransferase [Bacilli bacterium]
MELPAYVQKAINILEKSGYEAYVVGGAVRDCLLKKKPNDYDVSTNARPEEVKAVFGNYYTLDTGIKHGTVTVFIDHHQLEITTYRNEGDYQDFRRPKKVTFVSNLDTDLQRRDFTINALAYNRKIIDRVSGIADLNNKIIRAIGNPQERFTEDPLRILRALRFGAELGFTIEPATKQAVFANAYLIEKVSNERINVEFNKLLAASGAVKVLSEYFPVILCFLPEYHNIEPTPYLFAISYLDDFILRLAAFFRPLAGATDMVMRRLKYSKALIKKVTFLIDHFYLPLSAREQQLTELLLQYEYDDLIDLTALLIAFEKAKNADSGELRTVQRELNRIYQDKKYFRISDLNISGRDLLDIGYQEGVGIRLALECLLSEVISGHLVNQKEDLLKRAEQIKKGR